MPFNFNQKAGCADNDRRRLSRITGLARVLAGIVFLFVLHHTWQASGTPVTDPYSLALAWNLSPGHEVVGYHLYYGAVSGDYTNGIVVNNVTTVTVSGLLVGVTYYFAITAIGADGQESGFSGEISYLQEFPSTQIQIPAITGGQFMLTVAGRAGHTYDIEATKDFSNWTVIGTVALDARGLMNFTDTHTADFLQRFYRTHDTQP